MKLPVGYVAGEGVLKPTGYGGYGERMLKSMGWDKGQGLGKEGQGMKAAIEVKKKEDTVGVSSQIPSNPQQIINSNCIKLFLPPPNNFIFLPPFFCWVASVNALFAPLLYCL